MSAKVELVGFAGDAVLLSQDHGARWDVWPPAGGDYRPAWTEEVARVFGVAPGGETAIGLAAPRPGDPGPCLVRLRVASGLAVTARACPDSLPDLGPGTLSPTGRWLIAAASPPARPHRRFHGGGGGRAGGVRRPGSAGRDRAA